MSSQGERVPRGRRVGLTRSKVLSAALETIDRDGLQGLSMRRLGAALGVEAMTIYHYVPNKDALLDGVLEEVFRRSQPPEPWTGSWQEQLRAYARRLVDLLQAHPGIVLLMLQRPALTSQTLGMMEYGLKMLHEAGFPLPRALQLIHALVGLVIGHVAAGGAADGHDRLGRLVQEDLSAFPLIGRAVSEAAAETNLEEPFETALAAMIRGFETDLSTSA
ncbi:MAG TPA: TetR/AcrR family transcriptional regulator C-terminal domain-containing protein [Ruania sp.]|nr:TetR/AcrR family transcriptional regulator C-terminal domain-containing protein [Ruania sp.]